LDDLTQKVREQVRLYATRMRRVQKEERLSISRFLHDDTIQTLVAVGVSLHDLATENDTGKELNQQLERCPTLFLDHVEALRRLCMG